MVIYWHILKRFIFSYRTILFGILFHSLVASSQLTVTNVTPTAAVQNVLLGEGVEVNNIQFSGQTTQIGSFNCNNCGINLAGGVIIGSGNAMGAVGPNFDTGYSLGPPYGSDGVSDVDLVEVSGFAINNAAVLEFDFVPTGDSLAFDFVFGSEEYPEFVNSINDVFGFFISGPGITGPYANNAANIALIPGTTVPISINSVNNTVNQSYYVVNSTTPAPHNVQADGFTTVITARALVECGETYHIKLAIGDAMDGGWDSWVFLKEGSFQSNQPTVLFNQPDVAPPVGGIYEGCFSGELVFSRPVALPISETLYISIGGTASNGIDYQLIPDAIVFPPNETTVTIPLVAFEDAIDELEETIILSVPDLGCGGSDIELVIPIIDVPLLEVSLPDVSAVCGEEVSLQPQITGGVGNYTILWSNGSSDFEISFVPQASSVYTYTVSDACAEPVDGVVNIHFPQYAPLEVNLIPALTVNCLDAITLSPPVSGGATPYSYAWTQGAIASGNDADFILSTPTPTTVGLTVTDFCGTQTTALLNVSIEQVSIHNSLGHDIGLTCIDRADIVPTLLYGIGTYTYNWSVNSIPYSEASALLDFQAQETSTIVLEVEDQCGNRATDSMVVTLLNISIELELNDNLILCKGNSLLLSPVASGGAGTLYYQWNNGYTIPSFSVTPPATTVYELTVTDDCGYSISKDVTVIVRDIDAQFLTDEILTDVYQLTNQTLNASSFVWTLSNGQTFSEPVITTTPTGPGPLYVTLSVVSPEGCTDSLTVALYPTAAELFIPNCFSPDGDGINDFFFAKGVDIVEFTIRIFSRYGQKVFESHDIAVPWDGSHLSGDYFVQDNVYNYQIVAKDKLDNVITRFGSIAVIR